MASQSEAAYFQALSENNIEVTIDYALFALLIYDYVLNFPREVDLIWGQKLRLLSLLFVLNYYPRILQFLLNIILNSYTPHCTFILQFSGYTSVLSILADIVFQIIRTYAIWGQSWIVAISLSLLNIPFVTLNFWSTSVQSCIADTISPPLQKYQTIANITGLLFSILVVILTVIKTFQSARGHQRVHLANSHSLPSLIIKNGVLYFVSIMMLNIFIIASYFRGSAYLQEIGSALSSTLSTILISRFILDLRANAFHPNGTSSSHISSLRMAVHNIHSAIAEEFGDPIYHTSSEMRQANNDMQDIALEALDTHHAAMTVSEPINIQMFPWATGELGVVEKDAA